MKKAKLFLKILMAVAVAFLIGCAESYEENSTSSSNSTTQTVTTTGGTTVQDATSSAETYICEDYAEASAVIQADLYENFVADGTVYVNFDGTTVTAGICETDTNHLTESRDEQSLAKSSDTKVRKFH